MAPIPRSAPARSRIRSPATPPPATTARERLLAAADELFYGEGITTVGIDRVIARAGVAKATLYQTFGSKEALIRAYLEARQARRRVRIEEALQRYATPRERLLGIFAVLGEVASETGYRGCAFVNASAESATQEAVQAVCDQSRAWIRQLFSDLARAAGVREPAVLAGQLMVLYDGAITGARMDRTAAAVRPAQAVAAQLIAASVPASP